MRELADALFDRVDWLWMANGQNSLTMGWKHKRRRANCIPM